MRSFKICSLLLSALLMTMGCASPAASSSAAAQSAAPAPSADAEAKPASWEKGYLPQFAQPESGTPIVTLHTSMGDIKMMLFPQAAPKTVENFVTHCKNGYYNGVIFHRVIEDFMIQGGDPQGTGMGGESIWGKEFEDEFSDNLHNFRGAVSMANAGLGTNGSQFFIVQQDAVKYPNSNFRVTDETADNFILHMMMNKEVYNGTMKLNEFAAKPDATQESVKKYINELNAGINAKLQAGITDEIRADYASAIEKYKEVGGTPTLDYKHTVFGQVLEGMDVVDAIATVEKNSNDKPKTDVVIKSVTVEEAK